MRSFLEKYLAHSYGLHLVKPKTAEISIHSEVLKIENFFAFPAVDTKTPPAIYGNNNHNDENRETMSYFSTDFGMLLFKADTFEQIIGTYFTSDPR